MQENTTNMMGFEQGPVIESPIWETQTCVRDIRREIYLPESLSSIAAASAKLTAAATRYTEMLRDPADFIHHDTQQVWGNIEQSMAELLVCLLASELHIDIMYGSLHVGQGVMKLMAEAARKWEEKILAAKEEKEGEE